jgi:cytochrome c-type biogenesis protein CcmF
VTISLLGRLVILAALAICAAGAPIAFAAGRKTGAAAIQAAATVRRLAWVFGGLMAFACLLMEWALITHQFSVSYVAQVGSRATPLHITIVSLWSSLEGSILFWGLVLGLFTAGLAWTQRRESEGYLADSLGVLFVIGVFFTFLIAGPADPFRPTPAPIPTDGPGPNPLLQNHVLMIVHPPMLYLGYVGMSVPFAMAMAALLRGRLSTAWLRPLRNALLVPTAFLTCGIMLGGWWSYEVLGWGGYWAWDPVENASLLPWLTAIAAVHSALVLERKGTLRAWTVVLIAISFLLTILGTFLTRSGVVNSVHSFTQSPIGPLFLGFLGVALVAVVLLIAARLDKLASPPAQESLLTREGAFLINNLLFVAFMLTVLIGTLFPIIAEAVREVKVSVGAPYYDRMTVPMCLGLLFLLGIGPALPWGRPSPADARRALLEPLPAAAVATAIAWFAGGRAPMILFVAALAGFTLWITGRQLAKPSASRRAQGASLPEAVAGSAARQPRWYGGYLAHLGVIVTFVAIAVSSTYQEAHEARLQRGQAMQIGDYTLTLAEVGGVEAAHRAEQRAVLSVSRKGKERGSVVPSLNFYPTQREPIGTPSVRTRWSEDLYVTLMSVERDGSAGIRAIVTPAVVWIWIGVFVIVAGMGLCLVEGRGSKRARESAA